MRALLSWVSLGLLLSLNFACSGDDTASGGEGSGTGTLSGQQPANRPAPGDPGPSNPGTSNPGPSNPGPSNPGPSDPFHPQPQPAHSTANQGFGYTMGLTADDRLAPGTVLASCHGLPQGLDSPHAGSCNPYTGDTSCERALPVLCVRKDESAAPGGFPYDFYNGWAEGHLAATAPVIGASLHGVEEADALCREQLGEGFRMAEHHDAGGGWGLVGWDDGLPAGTRLWTRINDQPGNCWDAGH